MQFDRTLIVAAALVVPPTLLGFAPRDPAGWLLALAAGLGLTAFFYWVQRRIQSLGRGRLGREMALGVLLQPLAGAGLVSSLMLGRVLLGSFINPAQAAAMATPGLDPLTEGYRPFALAADLVELGLGGLAAFGVWALNVCGLSILALLFALLYPPLRNWLQRPTQTP
ncbi:MAG: hypothetical protein KIS85_00380 [Anaerolineales bacterium]|nr:hypothetical protein [Anaerolineales bacterium]